MLRAATLLISVALTVSSCSTPKGPALHRMASTVNETLRVGEDLIEPGDLLRIRIRSGDEASGEIGDMTSAQDVRVQPDGHAAFEDLEPLEVAGLLPSVLDEVLTSHYARASGTELSVTVGIAERAPRTITVFGEVGRPGLVTLPADGRIALVAALGRAGGPRKRNAWLSNILLVRVDTTDGEPQAWTIDARQQHWGKGDAVYLQNGDVLFVPNTNVDRVAIGLDNYVRRMIPFPYLAPPPE